jgi:outer membrane protein OmpU
MRKVLLATTALATVAGVASVASADVSISGSVQWQYLSISDDNASRSSDAAMSQTNDLSISFSTTTDSGLTLAFTQNIGDSAVGTSSSSISGDFGTVEYSKGSSSAHAASSYQVTAPGTSGGYGDSAGITTADGSGLSNGMSANEADIDDAENGVVNYHSPNMSGLTFGVGTSHMTNSDADSSTSYGIKYAGSAGDISYSVGYGSYDKGDVEASIIGMQLSMSDITIGMARATDKASATDDAEVTSYGITYAVSDALSIGAGMNKSENMSLTTTKELEVTSIGAVYTIAPGLTASLASHSFDYKTGGTTENDGTVTQAEIKMSF